MTKPKKSPTLYYDDGLVRSSFHQYLAAPYQSEDQSGDPIDLLETG